MPYDVERDDKVLRLVMRGEISAADLWGVLRDVEAIEAELPVAPSRIVDLTPVTVATFTANDMLATTARRRRSRLANDIRTAVVAPEAIHVGYARMFQQLNEHPQIEIRIFPTMAAAERWVAGGD